MEVQREALLGESGRDGDVDAHGVSFSRRQGRRVARHRIDHLAGRNIAHGHAAQQSRRAGDKDVLAREVLRQVVGEVYFQSPVAVIVVRAVARTVPGQTADEGLKALVLSFQPGVDIVSRIRIARFALGPITDGSDRVVLVIDKLHLKVMRPARSEEFVGP